MNQQINPKNSPFEVVHVTSKKVSCQGERSDTGSVSGHPLVYLDMGKKDFIVCPYCSKYFTTKEKNANNSVIIGLKNQIKSEK